MCFNITFTYGYRVLYDSPKFSLIKATQISIEHSIDTFMRDAIKLLESIKPVRNSSQIVRNKNEYHTVIIRSCALD